MPVIDHPVHHSTKKDETFRYGCHNVPCRSEGYWAHPWSAKGGKFVPFRMSHGCAYDLSANDPACEGCFKRKENGPEQLRTAGCVYPAAPAR